MIYNFHTFFSCRREQIAELTRLGQTLMHVGRLFWIVADDSESCNPLLDKLMDNFGEHRSVLRACGAPSTESVIKFPLALFTHRNTICSSFFAYALFISIS